MRLLGNSARLAAIGLVTGFLAASLGMVVLSAGVPEPAVSVLGRTVSASSSQGETPDIDAGSVASASTVRITTTRCDGTAEGLGTVINGQVFTARHVVEHASSLRLQRDGEVLDVATTLVGESHDVAVITLESDEPSDVFVRTARAEPGEPLVVARGLAFSLSPEPTAVRETRRGAGRNDPPTSLALVTTAIPGDSGGGVFDASGGLVGIVYAQAYSDRAALVIPSESVSGSLASLTPQQPAVC